MTRNLWQLAVPSWVLCGGDHDVDRHRLCLILHLREKLTKERCDRNPTRLLIQQVFRESIHVPRQLARSLQQGLHGSWVPAAIGCFVSEWSGILIDLLTGHANSTCTLGRTQRLAIAVSMRVTVILKHR